MQNVGVRRYLYEYLVYRAIEDTKARTGTPIMVSQVRHLRDDIDTRLAASGKTMDDSDLGISTVLTAIDESFTEGINGYEPVFGDHTSASEAYQRYSGEFMDMIGFDRGSVRAQPGTLGPRLPISPYDSRFSTRATVKSRGSALLFVRDEDIELAVDGLPANLATSRSQELKFMRPDRDNVSLVEAGDLLSIDDLSGMSELMSKMSRAEFEDVRPWVISGAMHEGTIDHDRFMTPAALARAAAILDELGRQGVEYTVARDLHPGQIKAQIDGTKISIRLVDTRENEQYVGRVYDDGAQIYLSTNHVAAGEVKVSTYEQTPADCVDLVRFAQGLPVARRDNPDKMVGQVGSHYESRRDPRTKVYEQVLVNDSYTDKGQSSVVLGNVPGDPDGRGSKIVIRRDGRSRSAGAFYFADAEKGEAFLREAVSSARTNMTTLLDVERLIADAAANAELIAAGEYSPEFDSDPTIAAIQRSYWDVLTGRQADLLMPGADEEEYYARAASVIDAEVDDDTRVRIHDMMLADLAYKGSAADQVRAHSLDVVENLVGQFDMHEVTDLITGETRTERFNPVTVSTYMVSEHGSYRNTRDIIAALRAAGISGEELAGDDYYVSKIRDDLIVFDETSAVREEDVTNEFVASMLATTREAIEQNGCRDIEIQIDANGVVRYSADRVTKEKDDRTEKVTGEIGQIFTPGEFGEIVTKFAGGRDYMFVPGYEARIIDQLPGQNLSEIERTRLRGMSQVVGERIRSVVSSDLLSTRTEVGTPTSLNRAYSSLYDVRHPVDFIERSAEEGLSPERVAAILRTEGQRVRYSNALRNGSTVMADFRAKSREDSIDPSNDNFRDPYIITGGTNMAILSTSRDGYFDKTMTASGTNQGITAYLVDGASVDPVTGAITPSPDKDARCALLSLPELAEIEGDSFDRKQMTLGNVMRASAITEPVGMAMTTFGGWNFDDGIVVSSRFAQTYKIRGADGELRDLQPGDKLSDLHGNKGVISLVVDPQMDLDEAERLGVIEAVETFSLNPDLDIVMAPFSPISRFNGGGYHEMRKDTRELVDVNGNVTPHGIGKAHFIVTHKSVDGGTRAYGQDDIAAGRGRKASSQLAWALQAQGASEVMRECYGMNTGPTSALREMLVTMGLDMEADGTLRVGRAEQSADDVRRLFEMPELVITDNGRLDLKTMRHDFGELIRNKGGDLELPFPLEFPTGEQIPNATDSSWALPVMSSHLRSGQDLGDGTTTTHDYTNHYLAIHVEAIKYRHAQMRLEQDGATLTPAQRKNFESVVRNAPSLAQVAFNSITDDLERRRFSGKRNFFKEQLMAARMPHSATAVWTGDPRNDIDEVKMNSGMAAALGVREGERVLMWRDPVWRDSGVRYMRVGIDDSINSVSINPAMDKCFDGDFDGDSVGIVRLTDKDAIAEATMKLSVEMNLLDLDIVDENGLYPLNMQNALDLKVAQHRDPELKEWFDSMYREANEVYAQLSSGQISVEEAFSKNSEITSSLSTYYKSTFKDQYLTASLTFGDEQSHIDSVYAACIETGAKGSESKLKAYARYAGLELEGGVVTPITTTNPLGFEPVAREEELAVQYATAVKSHVTGVAGSFTQRGVRVMRDSALKANLGARYPISQSVLQIKHNPEEAKVKIEVLNGAAVASEEGKVIQRVPADPNVPGDHPHWVVVKDDKGRAVQATREQWVEQAQALYADPYGLNVPGVNPVYFEQMADALVGEDGLMRNPNDEPKPGEPTLGSPMDRLAYGGDFALLQSLCEQNANIFSGELNSMFAPEQVRRNAVELERYDRDLSQVESARKVAARNAVFGIATPVVSAPDPQIAVVGAKDVLVDSAARGENARSQIVRSSGRKLLTVGEAQARNEAMRQSTQAPVVEVDEPTF